MKFSLKRQNFAKFVLFARRTPATYHVYQILSKSNQKCQFDCIKLFVVFDFAQLSTPLESKLATGQCRSHTYMYM